MEKHFSPEEMQQYFEKTDGQKSHAYIAICAFFSVETTVQLFRLLLL